MKIILFDIFNNREISRHRSVSAAVKARNKKSRQIRKTNGQNSYLPMTIFGEEKGERIDISDRVYQEEFELSQCF